MISRKDGTGYYYSSGILLPCLSTLFHFIVVILLALLFLFEEGRNIIISCAHFILYLPAMEVLEKLIKIILYV